MFDYKEDVADQIAEKGIYVDATVATGYMRTFRDPDFDDEAAKMFRDPGERAEILQDMRKKGIKYSIDSWKNYWYVHTNHNAEDYQVLRCDHKDIKKFSAVDYQAEVHLQ